MLEASVNSSLYVSKHLTTLHSFTGGIEGPAADRDGNVYAVNFARQSTIGRVTPDGKADIWLELPDGSVGNGIRFNSEGDMFIADYVHHRIYKVAAGTNLMQLIIHAFEPLMHQPNDIAINQAGYLFASDPDWASGTGNLWKISPNGQTVLLEKDMGTTNGIEVSPCERVLYVNETVQRRIWAYDLTEQGEVANKRLFASFPDYSLDGMRCDRDGNLYVTRHGKGVIAKLSPEGELLREIPLLGKDCTNICFGGPDGRRAYVTVADTGNIQYFDVEVPGRCFEMWRV